MIGLKEQEELFKLIGNKLKEKVECFVIGGSAMMYYGIKENTKDVDLVFDKEKSKDLVLDILISSGYKQRSTFLLYPRKKNVPILLEFGESRIDLFSNKIISFKFTESMKNRVRKVYEYENLIVKIISPDDIILLKSATERAGDRLDAVEILKKYDVDWNLIINESVNQTRIGEHVFPVFLFDFLEDLKEDLKADIPQNVLNKIRKIAEDEMIKHIKKK